MQQDPRQAMEQVDRDSEPRPTYVYPPNSIKAATATSVYTGEHAYMVNYSTLSFVVPA